MKKETFCKILNSLAEANRTADKLEKTFLHELDKVGRAEFITFGSLFELMYDSKLESYIISALEEEMEDAGEWIQYYCWELNWGTEKYCTVTVTGKEFVLNCAENLYDLLVYDNSTRYEKEQEAKPVSLTIDEVTDILKKYSEKVNE